MQFRIELPQSAQISVKPGESVRHGQSLFKIRAASSVTIAVSRELGVKPESIFSYLTKVIGEVIEEGAVLAEKKSMLKKRTVTATQSGLIKAIDHELGTVLIETHTGTDKTYPSFFEGRVITFDSKKEVLTIELPESETIDLSDCSPYGGGELIFVNTEDFYAVEEENVTGKIIAVKTISDHFAAKLDALGAAGVVYFSGDTTSLPFWAKVKSEADFDKFESFSSKNIVISKLEKKAVVY